ncbi:MAG: hypothetical protein AAF762_08670 [Pseudomonadota bacterium]
MRDMAFGVLVVGMIMGLAAAAALLPSDAGLFLAVLSYVAVGSLTLLSVIMVAIVTEPADDDRETR